MKSKRINSPYSVALIAGMALGLGVALLVDPLLAWDGPLGRYTPLLFCPGLVAFLAVAELLLKRFFGFQGFVLSGKDGSRQPILSYTLLFVDFFLSMLVIALAKTLLGVAIS